MTVQNLFFYTGGKILNPVQDDMLCANVAHARSGEKHPLFPAALVLTFFNINY